MSASTLSLPDDASLSAVLPVLPLQGQRSESELTIVERQPLPPAGTHPKELLRCRLFDGSEIEVFCKYSADLGHESYGHRGGVAVEASVYRLLLERLDLPTARFYGSHEEETTGGPLLFLEHLDGADRLDAVADPDLMPRAAEWIGRFHAAADHLLARGDLPALRRYDARYYGGWSRRATLYAGDREGLEWVRRICEAFEERAAPLLERRATVVHGEYYPKNILVRGGTIYPVDWESAAVAAGEVDLASLTEGWPLETAQRCESVYAAARWPEGPPADFEEVLTCARVYMSLRWLGDRPEWMDSPAGGSYLGELWRVASAAQLG